MTAKTYVLAGGGTGGHIFPALSVAEQLLKEGHRVLMITDKRFAPYVNQAQSETTKGLVVYTIPTGDTRGGLIRRVKGFVHVLQGIWQSMGILRREKPAAIAGFGGYPSFPAMVAAIILRVPAMIHEQNAVMGRVNRLLAPYMKQVALTFTQTRHLPKKVRSLHVGTPVRSEILALQAQPYPAITEGDGIAILVTGGSQGASVFSEVLPAALKLMPEALRQHIHIVQQCREADIVNAGRAYELLGLKPELATFFNDIPARLAKAHLVIARSGASTLAELAVAGRPAILVPYPYAKDNHQFVNAKVFVDKEAGWLVAQEQFNAEWLALRLQSFLEFPKLLEEAAAKARQCAVPDAAERLSLALQALEVTSGK